MKFSAAEMLPGFLDITDAKLKWVIQTPSVRLHVLLSYPRHLPFIFLCIMQFSLKKLNLREDWTLPSFRSMFPAAVTQTVDTSMTLGGLPPLHPMDQTESANTNVEVGTNLNEIVTAFESLDAEAAGAKSDGSLPLEFQCRYRKGKCSQPRTLKKNGSMHSYCEHHRQLSIRNQRVFDQKKRRQLELESEEPETQPKRPRRRSTTISSREEVNETQTSNTGDDLDTKHFSRSSDSTRVTTI